MEDLLALRGNAQEYSLDKTPVLKKSPLRGKLFYFLGSSVTLGETSLHESMADFIAKRNGCVCIKNAVSGTTLADTDSQSYVRRLLADDRVLSPDLFVCQLSTNDAARAALHADGELSAKEGGGCEEEDISTTAGAIAFIAEYAKKRFSCPVLFYSNAYFENKKYAETVEFMRAFAERKGVCFLDLYSDVRFNRISEEERALYMHDDVHPLRAGYRDWWTPRFEREFAKALRK